MATPHTDSVATQMKNARAQAAATKRTAPPRVKKTGATAGLAALGPQKRPNGAVYYPRQLGTLEDLAFLRDARTRKAHTLLVGPPGTGKTAMAEGAFAIDATNDHSGMETLVGTADTTEADFVGTWIQDPVAGTFVWAPGPLMRSVELDVPLLVDEIALIEPRVLTVLYALMDGRGELRVPANPHLPPLKVGPGWFVIAACNPDVPGAQLSDALLSRFAHHVEVTTDWDLALDLGVPLNVITVARNLHSRKYPEPTTNEKTGKQVLGTPDYEGWIPQLRDLMAFAEQADLYGEDHALAGLLRKCPAFDRQEFTAALAASYPDLPKPLSLGGRMQPVGP